MAWLNQVCCKSKTKSCMVVGDPILTTQTNSGDINAILNATNVDGEKKDPMLVSGTDENTSEQIIEVYEKDNKDKEVIQQAIRKNDFLNNMMDENRLEAVTMAMYPQRYEPNQFIILEGDIGSHVYVSAEGIFDVLKNNVVIRNFGAGVAFGELGVLYQAKRFASIRANSATKVWVLKRKTFHRIMVKWGRLERQENYDFLKSVGALKDLADVKLHQVADLLKREFHGAGSSIVTQGDEGDKFYIIRAGIVKVVTRAEDGQETIVNYHRRGEFFGEQALLHRIKRLATVIAEPPGTECLTLDRRAFEKYLGTLEQIRLYVPDTLEVVVSSSSGVINGKYSQLKLSDLEIISTLGVGSYGRVELVKCKKTNGKFALKCLKKHEIVELKYQKNVYSEKDVMASCENVFIVALYRTFRDAKYVYFLMEPCLGGDLWSILQKNKYFDETVSRFVTACTIEALAYMHKKNLIYRDLKPENLMLTSTGYIKLVDFGFAKRLNPAHKTWTFAGTPEYVAPEIILNKGHDRAVDFWAIGILVHELLTGKPAFRGHNHAKTFNLIVGGIDSIQMPIRIQRQAHDLIKQLCRQNPTERLGYAKVGVSDIRHHSWFDGFEWESLRNQTMKAPRLLKSQDASGEIFPKGGEQPPDETSGWDIYF